MSLSGYSVPETLTDDAGNALKSITVTVTGPSSYSGTATTDATTGILRLGPLPVGDYTVTYRGRSVTVPVVAAAADIQSAYDLAVAAETPVGAQTKATAAQTAAIAAAATDAASRVSTEATTRAGADSSEATARAAGDALAVQKASNLSDVASASTARTNLGLGNVNNTSDANKPVSTAQAAADAAVQAAAVQRANHTGTQLAATVSDFNAAAAAAGSGTYETLSGGASKYAIKGRRDLAVYDEFGGYADGALAGKTPMVGPNWQTSGAVPTTVVSGKATSTGTGYLAAVLSAAFEAMTCELVWTGSGSGQAMTMIMSTDASITVTNAVHCNFGPLGFNLSVRKDAGTFDSILTGVWRQQMAVDSATVYQVSIRRRGNTLEVIGPNGETFAVTDSRISLLAGTMGIWEPTTSAPTQCLLVSAGGTTRATSGKIGPTDIPGLTSNNTVGVNGQTVGSRSTAREVSIGIDTATNLPALILGPSGLILATLQAGIAIGATSISTDQYIPNGSSVQIESGTNTETVIASANSTGSGPYATTVGATTKAHAAGVAVAATVAAGYTVKFTNNNGTVTAPASMIFTNIYFAGQTTKLAEASSGVFYTGGSGGTGKGAIMPGRVTTAGRPTAAAGGQGAMLYDTTLSKPIWSDGATWRDAAGTAV